MNGSDREDIHHEKFRGDGWTRRQTRQLYHARARSRCTGAGTSGTGSMNSRACALPRGIQNGIFLLFYDGCILIVEERGAFFL